MRWRAAGVVSRAFWQRLVGHHRRRTGLVRPRAPLVLRRNSLGAPVAGTTAPVRERWAGTMVLHMHLAWPAWLRPGGTAGPTAPAPATTPARTDGRRTMRSAPSHLGAARSLPHPAAGAIRPVRWEWTPSLWLTPHVAVVTARTWAQMQQGWRGPTERSAPGPVASMAGLAHAARPGARPLVPAGAVRLQGALVAGSVHLLTRNALDSARPTGGPFRAASPLRGWNAADSARPTARRFRVVEPLVRRRAEAAVATEPGLRLARRDPSPPGNSWHPIHALVQWRARLPASNDGSPDASRTTASNGRFFQPASRTLAQPAPAAASSTAPASHDAPSVPAPSATASRTAPPQIDIARLSDEVYRQIERRARIERERRGA
jgi:hypothetical protein